MRFKLAIILTLIIPNIMRSQNATATIANAQACSGENVLVAVNVTNFNDVAAMTLFVGYDTNAAEFISIQNINPVITGFFNVNADNGEIGIAYSSVTPFTLSSGKIFDLQFTFLGDSSNLPFNPGTEIANSNLEVIPLTTYAGGLSNGFVIVAQPENVQAYPDNDVTFIVASTGNPAYQWQENSGNGWVDLQNNQNYNGVNDDTLYIYDVSLEYNENQYRCILTSASCEDTTQTALLEVAFAFPSCTLGTLSSCPEQQVLVPLFVGDFFDVVEFTFVIALENENLVFTGFENIDPVIAGGNLSYALISDPEGLMIQWSDDIPYSTSSGKLFDLAFNYLSQNNALTFEEGTEILNSQSNPVNATLTDGEVLQNEVPVITQQPVNITVEEGDEAIFKVTATNATSYQWQVSNDGGNSWTLLTGSPPYFNVTSPQLTIDPTTLGMDGYQYNCILGNEECSLESANAILSVDSLTGIVNEFNSNVTLEVTPNPFDRQILVAATGSVSGTCITIYTSTGTVVYSGRLNDINEKQYITLPDLPGGMYFLHASGTSGTNQFHQIRKIIKSN